MPTQNNHGKKTKTALKTGAGLAALAAAAAGIYYFYGSKEGAVRRKALKGWTVKARGEIMERLEKLENIDREAYNKIVDQVISRYRGVKDVSVGELLALGKELKGHWGNISKGTTKSQTGKSAKRSRSKKSAPKSAASK
jgi:hypothetical protein